jgi:outer membrane protein assembly factor BamB
LAACIARAQTPAAPGANSAPLGAPDFRPTPERPIGWRGDGTGRYTGATPPVTWSRIAASFLQEAKVQAKKPAGAAASGQPLPRGLAAHYLPEWLVAGPFDPAGDAKPLEKEFIGKDADLSPDDGDKVWKRTDCGSGLNLAKAVGGMTQGQVAYACTYVYMPQAGKLPVAWWCTQNLYKLWINGKPCNPQGEWGSYEFVQGWNRILLKGAANAKGESSAGAGFSPPGLKYEDKNIRWVTPMPGEGYSMPAIVGDKLFICADQASLVCLDKNTGKILWMRSTTVIDAAITEKGKLAEDAEAKAALAEHTALIEAYVKNPTPEAAKKANENYYQKLHNVSKKDPAYAWQALGGWGGGSSSPSPTTDGESVFVYYGDFGLAACFDLEGNRKWTRYARTNGAHHGINATPHITGNTVVVYGHQWIAYDKKTGKDLWTVPQPGNSYGSPVRAFAGKDELMVAPDGVVVRAADGKVLASRFGRFDGECASAVVDNERFFLFARAGFAALKLPATENAKASAPAIYHQPPDTFKPWAEPYPVATPLYHEGLVYAAHSAWGAGDGKPYLIVFEADTGKIVYKVVPDVHVNVSYSPKGAGLASSLTLAGKYIYMFDNLGSCIVFEPGREFKQVAKNVIHSVPWPWHMTETMESSPVFDGARLYFRGCNNLYCIGEK